MIVIIKNQVCLWKTPNIENHIFILKKYKNKNLVISLRSFIAIDVEEKTIIEKIIEIEKKLQETGALLKLVEPENLHITIKFLGEISEKELPLIKKILEKNAELFEPFEITLEKLGAFPSISHPRVIWVGISQNKDKVTSLANKISADLERAGFRREERAFHPHITIARVKRQNSRLKKEITQYQNSVFGRMIINNIRLKKSTLTPQGPIYTTIFEIPIKKEK